MSESILALIDNKRLSATSCMTGSPHWPALASALSDWTDRIDIGLHLTLTDQEALGVLPKLAPDKRLPSLGELLKSAYLGKLDFDEVKAEISRQFDAFENAMGRGPDYVDGHHHVHQIPAVRKAMLEIAVNRLQGPRYVRVCSDSIGRISSRGISLLRTLVIGGLGSGLRRQCESFGLRTNNSFAGVYDFSGSVAYAELFKKFCRSQKRNGIIMCHPGFVDDELREADELTDQRTVEHDFFMSAEFLESLERAELFVSRFRD